LITARRLRARHEPHDSYHKNPERHAAWPMLQRINQEKINISALSELMREFKKVERKADLLISTIT
jgi:hypothetical protein